VRPLVSGTKKKAKRTSDDVRLHSELGVGVLVLTGKAAERTPQEEDVGP
jgi:hypothetical protein